MIKKMIIALAVFIGILVLGLLIFLQQPQFGSPPNGTQSASFVGSPRFTGEKFENKGGVSVNMSFGQMLKMMPEWLNSNGNKRPAWSIPVVKRNTEEFTSTHDTLTRVTWFGHSAFLLEMDGKKILIDPMLGPSPSPVSFINKRFNDTLPITIDNLPDIDAVLFSHDHYDHLDYGSIMKLKEKTEQFYMPLGVGAHFRKWGVAENRIHELAWWDDIVLDSLKFTCTPARHFSGRGFTDKATTLWASWVIQSPDKNIYFSGDSG